jgi:hypothetical protein
MTCKGICIRHKAQKPVGAGRYSTGQKRCQICELFLRWDGLWCPCCGYRLRTRPRNLKYKAKLRARKQIDEYRSVQLGYLQLSAASFFDIKANPTRSHTSHKKL